MTDNEIYTRPFPNEHAARLRKPGDFDPKSFRRTSGGTIFGSKKVPKTISIIWAKLKGKAKPSDPVLPQSLRFPIKNWTVAQARKWLKDNNITVILFEKATKGRSRNMETTDEILEGIANGELSMRSAHVTPQTINEKEKSIEAILASEARVPIFDWKRGEIVDEILLADGFHFADTIPFLDSHNRFSIEGQIGSIRKLHLEKDKLVGRVFFGRTEKANDAFIMAQDGHITDLSIGFRKEEVIFVDKGQKFEKKNGRSIKGPANISIRTEVKEGSLTPIGADPTTKLRGQGVQNIQDLDSVREIIYNLENELDSARKAINILTIANKIKVRS